MGACSISPLRTFCICRDHWFVMILANIKNLITNCVVNRLMSILFSFQPRNFIKLIKANINSFGAKFRRYCRLVFFFNKVTLEKKFIRKVERLNVKQL